MPLRYFTIGIRIRTASHYYDSYLDPYDVNFQPLRVTVEPQPISEQQGGFGIAGGLIPGAVRVSRRLLVAGQNVTDYTNDPSTTFAIDEIPTSCLITVRADYQQGETIDIPLVP